MRKIMVLCLCAVLCLPITACAGSKDSAGVSNDSVSQTSTSGSREDSKGEKTASTIGDHLDSGKFLLDGREYSFPSAVKTWTNHGWHVSNNYSNKDSFKLEPSIESTTFEMYQDDSKHYVGMKVYNNTNEDVTLDGGLVSYVKVKFSSDKDDMKVELPGGVTYKSTMDDVIKIYGEPTEKEDDELLYKFESDDWIWCVYMEFDGGKIRTAEYFLSDDNWGSIKTAEECVQFVDDALKTSFYCDYERYVENKFATEESAIALYEGEVAYYTEQLMYYLDVNYEIIDEEIIAGYVDVTEKVFAKFKWDTPVFKTTEMSKFAIGDAIVGDLELTLYPTDFIGIIYDDAQAVLDAFQEKYNGVDVDSLSDEEYLAIENEYAENMLAAISLKVDEISYLDPIVKTYGIDTYNNGAILSEDEWAEIDDILMSFYE